MQKVSGKPYPATYPAPQPKHRLQDLPLFSVTGVDFTGALHVHNNNGETNLRYIYAYLRVQILG